MFLPAMSGALPNNNTVYSFVQITIVTNITRWSQT
jgi:hypothetical protein